MITIERLIELLEESDCDLELWAEDYDDCEKIIVEFPIRLNHSWHAGRTGSNRYKPLTDLHEHPPSCLEDFPKYRCHAGFDYYDQMEIINWKNNYENELSKIPKQQTKGVMK